MKTLLIHCPAIFTRNNKYDTSDINIISAGLIAIANKIKAHGFPVEVVHLGVELAKDRNFKIERYIRACHFDVIGISINWHKQLSASLKTAQAIKR